MENLNKQILLNDASLRDLFCKSEEISKDITYYHDDDLTDMYDHNFYVVKQIEKEHLDIIEEHSKDKKHIKIISDNETSLDNYEHGHIITMCKQDYDDFHFEENKNLVFKDLKNNDIFNDILNIEIKHYGKSYGESFTTRKLYRFSYAIKANDNLNMIGAYLDNKLVGYCYAYANNGVVAIDDLLVDEEYRNLRIASTLIKHICNLYKSPMYLHADFDDTPKFLYKKLGFVVVDYQYEYLRIKNGI